jgi:hypothetical protein
MSIKEMEELDEDAQQRRETFARYGLAMYHAQCVEKSLAILVSSVFNKEFLPSEPYRREAIQDEVFAKTITRLKTQITIPPNLDRTLTAALKKRNWLTHDYFWERAGQLLTPMGREKMIEELTILSDFFSKLDAHLTKICETWLKKAGVSEAAVDESVKRLIQNAKEDF